MTVGPSDDLDAAVVIALVTALASAGGREPEPTGTPTVWGDRAHVAGPGWGAGPNRWWASGLPR